MLELSCVPEGTNTAGEESVLGHEERPGAQARDLRKASSASSNSADP